MADHVEEISPQAYAKIDEIQTLVPEYQGFEKPEDRRTTDEAVRAFLSTTVHTFLLHVRSLEAYLSRTRASGAHDAAVALEGRIENLFDKIQSTPYAFSPFFTVDLLRADCQESVIMQDHNAVEYARQIRNLMKFTLCADSDFGRIMADAERAVSSLDESLESRFNTLSFMEYS